MIKQKLHTLEDLLERFAPEYVEKIEGHLMPEPYKSLLVHQRHMTITLERYWQSLTELHVVEYWDHHPYYARKVYLTIQSERKVELGLVQLDFNMCSRQVQAAIRARQIPLGRILSQHGVLTEINCRGFFKLVPSQINIIEFDLPDKGLMYGRFAEVEFDGEPAMTLIEVMPSGLEVNL